MLTYMKHGQLNTQLKTFFFSCMQIGFVKQQWEDMQVFFTSAYTLIYLFLFLNFYGQTQQHFASTTTQNKDTCWPF